MTRARASEFNAFIDLIYIATYQFKSILIKHALTVFDLILYFLIFLLFVEAFLQCFIEIVTAV